MSRPPAGSCPPPRPPLPGAVPAPPGPGAPPRLTPVPPPSRPAWQSPSALVSAASLVVAVAIIVLNQKPAPTNTGGELFTPPITYTADIVDGDSLGLAGAPVVTEGWSAFHSP